MSITMRRMIDPGFTLQTHTSLETQPHVQTHTMLEETETVPHVFSWLVWAAGTFIVFLAQLAGGGGVGAWPIGFSACITGYIAHLAYRKRHELSIKPLDRVFLVLAMATLPAWLLIADPLWAVVLLTTADLIAFGPTLRRGYYHPHRQQSVPLVWVSHASCTLGEPPSPRNQTGRRLRNDAWTGWST
jgi:hypothetical protein